MYHLMSSHKIKNHQKGSHNKITSEDQAQMLYETMLPSTEQIMIIDSIIADKIIFEQNTIDQRIWEREFL